MSGHVKVRLSMTLFVENFPFQWNNVALRECFEKHCKVVDAYVANKLSKRRSKFGFIRVDGLVDVNALIQVMNGTVVGKRKLFVGLSKFSKPLSKSGNVIPMKGVALGKNMRTSTSKTFAEALIGRGGKGKEVVPAVNKDSAIMHSINTPKVLDFPFGSQVTVDEWLHRSVVCTMAPSQLDHFPEVLFKIGVRGARVRPLSGEDVLVTFISYREMEGYMGSLKNLCKKCEPWTIHFVPSTRSVWVQITGLPIHMWSKEVMDILVAPIGNMVRLHRDTEEMKRLDVAWVLISVSSPDKVLRHLKVSVQGICYHISISEIRSMDAGFNSGFATFGILGNLPNQEGTSSVEVVPETAVEDGQFLASPTDQLSESDGVLSPRGDNNARNISTDINSPLTSMFPSSHLVGNTMDVPCSNSLERVCDSFEDAQKEENMQNPTQDELSSHVALSEDIDVLDCEDHLGNLGIMEGGTAEEPFPKGPVRNSNRKKKQTAKGLAFSCSIKKKVSFIPTSQVTSPNAVSPTDRPEVCSPEKSSSAEILEARASKASLIGQQLGIKWDVEEGKIISELKEAIERARFTEKSPAP